MDESKKGLPREDTQVSKDASRRLQEHETIMHERLRWIGRPCINEGFLAAILRCAKDYLERLEEATGIIDKDEERDKNLMVLMLLFASVRPDLDQNLFADERKLTNEVKDNLRIQWRDLGFPIGIREKLRRVLLETD
ncbi:MAG TPA: hypothetical protein VEK15_01005 [Vicinamibacteria bacterium]|nr:hypothetical protein [Vicinamibacteria bacterium]